MQLQSFLANKGDSFMLTWGEANPCRLLIDAGTPGTYRYIKEEFKKTAVSDAILLTHVDFDHIGGLLKMMDDTSINLEACDIYMNHPELALAPDGNDKVSIQHGIALNTKMQTLGLDAKPMYVGSNSDDKLIFKGLELQVLSPTKEILDAFLAEWSAEMLKAQYASEQKEEGKVGRPALQKRSFEEILAEPESIPAWKNDLINAVSIAFLASFNGKSILFLGDANPLIVFNELSRLGFSPENKLKVNLCKLSHHGSKHNTSKNLLSVLDCDAYYISTDGTGPNYHPDRETIVRIAAYGRKDVSTRISIYTNYPLALRNVITEEECRDWNVSIENKNIVAL